MNEGFHYLAIASDGANCYLSWQDVDPAGDGFVSNLSVFAQAGFAYTDLANYAAGDAKQSMPLRLTWINNQNKLVAVGKKDGLRTEDAVWTGVIFTYEPPNAAAYVKLRDFSSVAPLDNSSALPIEMAVQTDSPADTVHVAVAAVTQPDQDVLYSIDPALALVSSEKLVGYLSPSGNDAATGIISNMVFVEQSGVAGGYLWSDRLYWQTDAAVASDCRLVQLGVRGDWEVRGDFLSEQKDLGLGRVGGNFTTVYLAPQIDFYFRTAANPAGLAASEKQISPNKKIIGGFGEWAQWRANLVWVYTLANPTTGPELDSVDVSYYLGQNTVPRVVAEHWLGRTYFFVAENGQPENNLVLVLQKNNSWTIFRGWNISGVCIFLGQFIGLQGYELVELLSGGLDRGAPIFSRVRPGTFATDSDLSLDDVSVNVSTAKNATADGALQVTPYAGNEVIAGGEWLTAIPKTAGLSEVRRVLGKPAGAFEYAWGNAYSLEIGTAPNPVQRDQPERVMEVDLKLVATEPDRTRAVN